MAQDKDKTLEMWAKVPLSDLYQIWHGEGVPDPHAYAKFHPCGFKNVGLQPPKSPKLLFFV